MKEPGRHAKTVGMLLFLTTCKRPDLAFSVGVLACFISKPREEHWARDTGVLHYLKQAADNGITMVWRTGRSWALLTVDNAADPDKRRSTGGYVFLMTGGAVSWGLKLPPSVATPTMAHGSAAKSVLWLRKLMETLDASTISV
jgi:hypothetical protein